MKKKYLFSVVIGYFAGTYGMWVFTSNKSYFEKEGYLDDSDYWPNGFRCNIELDEYVENSFLVNDNSLLVGQVKEELNKCPQFVESYEFDEFARDMCE